MVLVEGLSATSVFVARGIKAREKFEEVFDVNNDGGTHKCARSELAER